MAAARAGRCLAFVRRQPAWAVLGALIALSTALRGLASHGVEGPWISPDETVYSLLGQSLYRDGTLSLLGGPTDFYSLVVPVLVGPFLSFHDLGLGYALLKPFQAFVMSLAAVPVYCWARSLVSRRRAFAAAALALAVPGLAYSGLVMSEVAFYPIVTLAAWALARAIAVPTPRRQALLAAAVALAVVTRLQALVLVPVVIAAVGADAVFARSWRRALRSLPAVIGLLLLLALWQLVQSLRGQPLLGAYDAARATASVATSARFVLYHAGDLALMTGIVPVCAVLALGLRYLVRGESAALPRATVATGLALSAAVVLQVGVFASRHVGQLAERDLLALTPTLLVCFALWPGRAGRRPSLAAAAAAVAGAALVCTLPFGKLVTEEALPDALTLAPLWRLAGATSSGTLTVVVSLVAVALAALFVALPRRRLAALPALLLVAAVTASVLAGSEVVHQSRKARLTLAGPDPGWIDRATDRPVTFVYSSWSAWPSVWQALFWNRRIAHVVTVGGYRVPGPVPQRVLALDPSGRIAVDDPGLEQRSPLLVVELRREDDDRGARPGRSARRSETATECDSVVARAVEIEQNELGSTRRDQQLRVDALCFSDETVRPAWCTKDGAPGAGESLRLDDSENGGHPLPPAIERFVSLIYAGGPPPPIGVVPGLASGELLNV